MRRLHLTAAAIVSTALLLTTTSVLAIAPVKAGMGTLKPQGGWKVGTVNQGGENYCAMVGTYDNKVVAAFARNPQGLGSLALDFGDGMFTSGKQYDVTLKADGVPARTLKGRASNERSLVVQIGQDGSFYDALSKNGTLSIDLPVTMLSLDLVKFSDSHKDLVACAGQLTPSEQEAEPRQRMAQLPVDRELAELGQARTSLAAASTKADDLQKKIETKANSLDALEAQLEAEARAEIERSKTTIASIDAKQNDMRQQLAAKSGSPLDLSVLEPAAGGDALALPVPVAETPKASGGRRLLAAIGGKEQPDVRPSTGSSARDLESREVGLADAQRAASETAKALELKNEIAAIEAEKNAQAQKTMAAFDARRKELDAQTAKLSEKRDTSLAQLSAAASAEEKGRKLRADVVAQQAKIAEVSEVKQKDVQELPRQLAKTQVEFESRIAALEAERNQLREQVSVVTAENERLKQGAGQGNAEDRLEIARLKKQMLDMDTQRQAELSRASAAQKELDETREQIAALRQGSQAEMARLAELQRSLDSERKQIAAERSGLVAVENETLASLRKVLEKKQADLEAVAIEQGAEAARLQSEKDAIDKAKELAAATPSMQKLVDSERAELNDLRGRIKTLEGDLAQARSQAAVATAAVAAAPKPVELSSADKAEMARLKDENASLRQRLAGLLSGGEKTAEAKAAPVVKDAVVESVAEAGKPVGLSPTATDVNVAAVEAAPVDLVPVAQAEDVKPQAVAKTEKKKSSTGSPVLAGLFGQKQPVAAQPVEQAVDAVALNAAEPAAGAVADKAQEHLPGNDKRMPAVPAAKVEAEEVTKVASAQAPMVDTKAASEVAAVAPAAPRAPEQVVAHVPMDAEAEIARMAPITESVPLNTTVSEVTPRRAALREQPVTAKADQNDKGVFGLFGRLGYRGAEGAETVAPVSAPKAQDNVIRVTRPETAAAPAPRAQAVPATSGDITAADGNRAAAFLDNIMAFHRPTGSDATPSAYAAPVVQQPRVAAVQQAPIADTRKLNAIETAAGTPAMAAPVKTVAAPVARPAAVVAPASLQDVLAQAGLGQVQLTSGANGVAQWGTGMFNGMYESQPARGNFDQQVNDYLARYQDDCPGKLQVGKGAVQQTATGNLRVVDVTCALPHNSYATSVVFSQSQGHFAAILHAGQTADGAEVKRLGTAIADSLKANGAVRLAPAGAAAVVPASFAQQPAAARPAERPRFRIEIEAPAAAPEDIYDLPTTIIE